VQAALQEAHQVDASLQGESRIAGLVVADSRGLCIQAQVGGLGLYSTSCAYQGAGQAKSAGLLAAVASQAALLEPGEQPVILLETKNHHYLVKKEDNVTVAIIKNAA